MGSSILNLLYPENLYCICCGDTIPKNRFHSLCDKCIEKINWISDNPYAPSMDEFAFDDLKACCIYGYYPRLIIGKFKDGERYIAKPVAHIMSERLYKPSINEDGEITDDYEKKYDVIVFVPSTKEKLSARGYNQAKLLADEVSKNTHIPVLDALIKTKNTASMRKASMIERQTMLAESFDIKKDHEEKIKNKNVVLIDDVVTTGSTVNEVSKLLRNFGASSITVLAFACGTNISNYDTEE